MCCSVIPAERAKYSPVMWLTEPTPADPKLTLPRLAFAKAISSATLAAGQEGRTPRPPARRVADHADRREILARIVADFLVQRRPDRQRAGVAQQQRVAIGFAL